MRLPSLLRAFAAFVLATVLLVVLAPGCGRSSLEFEALDASADGGACGPSSCPNGCCDAGGKCRVGSDNQACGSRGQQCSDCIANGFTTCDVSRGRVCSRPVASCGPDECPNGCCSFDGGQATCLAGTDPTACGRAGDTCLDCAQQGRACDSFSRQCGAGKCDASNCAGCCVGDQCLTGLENTACGAGGTACTSCTSTGQTCGGTGSGGGQCQGTATCGPANCGGCCNGTQCVVGTDASACGKQGAACTNCGATGKVCIGDGLPGERTCQAPPACSPATCAGCCVGDACVIATTRAACGKGGEACKVCGPSDSCNAGACIPPVGCTAANCAGCCVGDVCAAGTQDTACGAAGIACANCAGIGRVCQGATCQVPSCSPANCAGCCSGNTCVQGITDPACGKNGAACTDCNATGQACSGQACVARCGPANCAGCCSSSTTCAGGFTGGACGSGGAACTNCTAQGSTCSTLNVPRLCANQAGLCPANYPGCAAGVATPVTPSLQNLCSDVADLDSLQAGCDGGNCAGAFAVLQATNPACAACIAPFNVPFAQGTGLYLCAAPFVNATCNRSTGCAADCEDTACDQCPAANETQCRSSVLTAGGKCSGQAIASACIAPAVGPGGFCRFDNRTFGAWLRAVGDHFCGNGP
ncbi:MAG: hypothetical protein JWP97_2672 [Labilithrix sp.]|nr:hypothetical protein [Labilithrix sp.]